jgi:hypothetical protein
MMREDDDHESLTLRRALRAPEFWLLLVASVTATVGVAWWVTVPLVVAGLSIVSMPKYVALWPLDAGMVIAGAAATTSDAERLASEGSAKLAVVDVKLQDGMAFDLIDHLHDLGVSVVVVSGFSNFSTPLGKAAAVLQKPFAGQELLGALARVC